MTRTEFEEKSFEEVMEQLNEERDDVTTIDILKDFIKAHIDEDNFHLASHLCLAIWRNPYPTESRWYLYDYGMGILDDPIPVECKEDVEHFIEEG